MPRKNRDGKFIISAGEIGAYTVCPEAWRLQMLEGVVGADRENSVQGQKLHKEWAEKYGEALFLSKGVKIIMLLLFIAVAGYVFSV